ncbi:hypothetical protein FLP41_13555 [Paracoccus marcusii]|nr:hypothetical protein FLP41_13555 [Paracoccus marcusii]
MAARILYIPAYVRAGCRAARSSGSSALRRRC